MSAHPPPATGGPANKDRLKAVLAAGVARLSLLETNNAVDVADVADVADVGAPAPRALQPDASRQRRAARREADRVLYRKRKVATMRTPPPKEIADLLARDDELLNYILTFSSGVSCKEIALQCSTSRAFAALCALDAFWRWQSQLRGYDRPTRLNPFRINPAPTGPVGGSWKEHYKWWCQRALNNELVRIAIQNLDRNTNIHYFYGHISDWDVSNVTYMNRLFFDLSDFNADLSRWDVSNVTNMNEMFYKATSFNSDLSNWNVSNVTSMMGMFQSATSFNSDISNWNVSKVRNMIGMFFSATSFNSDISNWNVSNVTDMMAMFKDATLFNQDLSGWDDRLSNVVDMSRMFESATSFNGDISKWNVSRVVNMMFMFRDAVSFNRDLSGWNVSNVQMMQNMFRDAISFNRDLSAWADRVSNVEMKQNMFRGSGVQFTPPAWYMN
jgi:surface protein